MFVEDWVDEGDGDGVEDCELMREVFEDNVSSGVGEVVVSWVDSEEVEMVEKEEDEEREGVVAGWSDPDSVEGVISFGVGGVVVSWVDSEDVEMMEDEEEDAEGEEEDKGEVAVDTDIAPYERVRSGTRAHVTTITHRAAT